MLLVDLGVLKEDWPFSAAKFESPLGGGPSTAAPPPPPA